MESLQTTLTLDQIQRFSFNSLIDFKKPARSPAEIVAHWEPIIAESVLIREERAAAVASLPCHITIVWAGNPEESLEAARAAGRAQKATEDAAFSQMMHCHKLRDSYSYELAHSLWYERQAAQKAIGDRVRAEYEATWRAEFAAQEVFENEQVAAAIAALVEANPHLSEETVAKVSRRLKSRLHIFFRRESRSLAPRRVMRGVPLTLCGSLPSKARLVYPAGHNTLIDRAF
jgi:hypothetical protein